MVLGGAATLAAPPAWTQGFAGLGRSAGDFAQPDPDYRFRFPRDHGPHPSFRIEWWYVTANLALADGTPCGVQWTLFRSALAPEGPVTGWQTPQAWMGHAGLTLPDRHFAAERLARGGIGQAGVVAEPFAAWIDEWRMAGPSLSSVRMQATGPDFGYDLTLAASGPFVAQGIGGYSVKSAAGQASHYYSQPFYRVEGNLLFPDGPRAVTGRAWLDREWSSQPLEAGQTGWDWFSLHLGAGEKLMGFRLRGTSDFTAATWIDADGTPHPMPDGAFQADPRRHVTVAGRRVPVAWRLRLAQKGLDIRLAALNEQAWMPLAFPYWEGPVTFEGSHDGAGYLEMTGYE
ncbi:hypothetical protein OCGS_0800 [Oceaniovalibus guishaninsula JLT2003]|uniref:AttH domain-containing protein n=1 Tax=Oceaniovalibus guishaninsula JLT2003 TaxID=1231392 RepID=K2I7W7_9RHOB|nr:hypothetical protein OCGS_0800 [Oceaniovalibus guishaninsula JLT2003]